MCLCSDIKWNIPATHCFSFCLSIHFFLFKNIFSFPICIWNLITIRNDTFRKTVHISNILISHQPLYQIFWFRVSTQIEQQHYIETYAFHIQILFFTNSNVRDSPSALIHQKFVCNQIITYSDVYSNLSNTELK